MTKKLIDLCRTYVNHTTCDEAYVIAHNAAMDAMREVGIDYTDREHAAEIARALVVLDDVIDCISYDDLVAAERECCAKIAETADCEKAPGEYSVTAPELTGLIEDWERQQCYHGDRIAEKIREESHK